MHRFASDPEAVAFVTWGPNTEDETRGFIDGWLAERAAIPRTGYTLALTEPPAGPSARWASTGTGPHHAELGFAVSRDRWGQGYATEAARAILDFGFADLGLRRIYATCRPENVGSSRVLEKIGMSREGRLRDHVLIRGDWRDSLLYAAVTPTADAPRVTPRRGRGS